MKNSCFVFLIFPLIILFILNNYSEVSNSDNNKNNIQLYDSIKVYPNPVVKKIKIKFDISIGMVCTKIYDVTGRCIFNQMMDSGEEQIVDCSLLSAGTYFINFDNIKTIKLIKI